jgi:aspartyl-tRNA(Asn)/glutamyl-tRNA(Gln) amidotransferase subunit A
MGATVSDVEKVYRVIEGHDPLDSTSIAVRAPSEHKGPAGLRVGIPAEFFAEGLDPGVRSSVERALARLQEQGAVLVPISLPNVHHSVACYYVIAVAEASSNLSRFDGVRFGSRTDAARSASSLEEFYCENRSLFGREVKRRILLGTFVLSSGYHDAYYGRACQVRELIRQDFSSAFSKVDLIASPVAPTPAFKIGEHSQSPLQMYLNDLYTIPANLAGLPALSVPVEPHSSGLPVGLQLMAASGGEDLLLAVGRTLEVTR